MINIFYTIIILPIIQIIEVVFVFFHKVFHNPAISVFGVSLTVSLLSLPLYVMAERWQIIERDIIKRFRPKIEKIKSVFSSDEQFMILSAFYRQNHYHPVYSLRSSLGILVQIPFFIAAYSYLTNLEVLQGVSFRFVADLGKPDSLFTIGSFAINILPVLMTLINCIAGAVYTKGLSLRDKIQVYGMALIFLVLLYNSPSCLVIYWTLNNIFSLVKNIFYRIKKPLMVFYFLGCIVCTLFIFYLLFYMQIQVFRKRLLVICLLSVFYFLPFIVKAIQYIYKNILSKLLSQKKKMIFLFLVSCSILFVLAGLFIPSSVIASSPEEFSFIDNQISPFTYLLHSGSFYFGFFLLWPVCIFFLFPDKIKSVITLLFSFLALIASIYTIIFSGNYGIISNTFTFTTTGVLRTNAQIIILSIAAFLLSITVILVFLKYSRIHLVNSFLLVLLFLVCSVSAHNFLKINRSFTELKIRQSNNNEISSIEPIFALSSSEKNIIVIMADGAVNGFVPLIFNDFPELYSKFDGFTLFRNTASFSAHTLTGVPPIWGGYDFMPLEINNNPSIPLVVKHNNALLTLPVLLRDSGFTVTVTDPSWANYAWIPDNSIYNGYENITAFNIERRYTKLWYAENDPENRDFTSSIIRRNIIWFSFLKINIPMLRSIIYDSGWYWCTEILGTSLLDLINSYSVLDYLSRLTAFDAKNPNALLITNEVTHNFGFLRQHDLKPTPIPSRIGTSIYGENDYYHVNAALYLRIGDWFDTLKKNNAYDNTRIIIVADHGSGIPGLVSDDPIPIQGERRENYNPVLLYKDFNQQGRLAINDDFMTNADVPSLALRDVLENPVNPFTGNPVNMKPKEDGIFITTSHIPMADAHGKYRFNIKKNQWIYLRDSIFESSNWEYAEK